ncbi:mitogen-activated protein kinase kinase kinase 20-like [Cornus florida]|uniref:mitogen-activated protein kinase kinase kinase 20-like n=1 Tax=Cornus florida TaxID=4283 RepID=UPI0028978E6A|nr:mitogen-activated protein kinase kinase kinase 20-like [Cornus florida]
MERKMLWTRGRKLGMGGFGVVSLAKEYQEGIFMAVKSAEVSVSHSLAKEKKILQQLEGCPYILSCFGDGLTTENGITLYNIMLEFASGGSLADRVEGSGGKGLSEFKVKQYTKTVLIGLSYIHKMGYVHCDIKPHNILLVSEDTKSFIIPRLNLKRDKEIAKIADFGLAMKIGKKRSPKLRGTAMYLAPESVRHLEYQPHSDIWALGCTVLQLITGTSPWHCEPRTHPRALLYRIGWGKKLPKIPSWVSKEAKDFLEKCLVDDPKSRWSADKLLGHSFVSSMGSATKDVKEERSKVFPSETRNAACVSSTLTSSLEHQIKPYKIMSKRRLDRQKHEENCSGKRRRKMQEVQELAQQQPNLTCYQRYWGAKRTATVNDSRDPVNFSLGVRCYDAMQVVTLLQTYSLLHLRLRRPLRSQPPIHLSSDSRASVGIGPFRGPAFMTSQVPIPVLSRGLLCQEGKCVNSSKRAEVPRNVRKDDAEAALKPLQTAVDGVKEELKKLNKGVGAFLEGLKSSK